MKFLICLAIIGIILAVAFWYFTGNPVIHAPLNDNVDVGVTLN